jgi:hypothetical protein
MAPLIGADSDAMHFLQEQIPTPEEPADQPAASEQPMRFNEDQAASSAPTYQPPARRPSAPRPDDDEDLSQRGIFDDERGW